jgi:hypothetical protein
MADEELIERWEESGVLKDIKDEDKIRLCKLCEKAFEFEEKNKTTDMFYVFLITIRLFKAGIENISPQKIQKQIDKIHFSWHEKNKESDFYNGNGIDRECEFVCFVTEEIEKNLKNTDTVIKRLNKWKEEN